MCISCSVVSKSLGLHRLLCPWNSLGKNTRVGCHSPLQGIFPTQGSNPPTQGSNSRLLHCRRILYHLSHQGSQKQGRLHLFMPHNTSLGQGPGSSGDIRSNIFLSSSGTKAPIQVDDRMMTLTLLNSITFSVDSVTLGPNSVLNAPLLKPPHEYACTFRLMASSTGV